MLLVHEGYDDVGSKLSINDVGTPEVRAFRSAVAHEKRQSVDFLVCNRQPKHQGQRIKGPRILRLTGEVATYSHRYLTGNGYRAVSASLRN